MGENETKFLTDIKILKYIKECSQSWLQSKLYSPEKYKHGYPYMGVEQD